METPEVETKNSELKHRPDYDTASASGFINVEMQGAMAAISAVKLKRLKDKEIF